MNRKVYNIENSDRADPFNEIFALLNDHKNHSAYPKSLEFFQKLKKGIISNPKINFDQIQLLQFKGIGSDETALTFRSQTKNSRLVVMIDSKKDMSYVIIVQKQGNCEVTKDYDIPENNIESAVTFVLSECFQNGKNLKRTMEDALENPNWVERSEGNPPENSRIVIFSPCYPKGDPFRFRIIDAQSFRICTEATKFLVLE